MSSLPGFEPGTFGLEVQRAIHCATGTFLMKLEKAMHLISRESSQCKQQKTHFLCYRKDDVSVYYHFSKYMAHYSSKKVLFVQFDRQIAVF